MMEILDIVNLVLIYFAFICVAADLPDKFARFCIKRREKKEKERKNGKDEKHTR